ncbi:MAG: amidohydrolase [Gammaproteobacteria bacterium]|nr:amidohydrolase [Gammaproteobacteria bacterium]
MSIENDVKALRTGGQHGYLRIATEEAFAPPEMIRMYRRMIRNGEIKDPGFLSLWGFYAFSKSPRAKFIFDSLQDLGEKRLADMDERGIDKQIIALTSPGTQILKRDQAVALAELANDQLAEACRKYPDRFAGMAACAPQDGKAAAKEIERGVSKLGFNSVIINSHTNGHYLDEPQFWPILEAAEALDVPIYIHPNTPPKAMIKPMLDAGLDGAIYGFGVETSLHALRLITRGVLDRFPKLQIIIGHMGEALPFWQYRIDYMHAATVRSKRYDVMLPLQRKPSEYLRENYYMTNSGVAWEPAIKFTQATVGVDRVVYAMDYPYQCDPEEVVALDAMKMSAATKKKFFQTNAEKLFKLKKKK